MSSSTDDDLEETEEADMMCCCASCGIAELDDVKLKKCPTCDLVRYCGVKCQREHWPKHQAVCMKRAAELRDEILFKQPESSYLGDCPICFLPLPLYETKSSTYPCCIKVICMGCDYVNKIRELQGKLQQKCPFCRKPLSTAEEGKKYMMKRVEANDPAAMCHEGGEQYDKGNYSTAFQYWTKASGLGDMLAHYQLSTLYDNGQGVGKDEKKEVFHLEEAAIGGHPDARYNLGINEVHSGRIERAVKHWIIAANLGHDESIQVLKKCYKDGFVSKEDLATALRAHQAAVDATKSPQREAGDAARARGFNC